MKNRDIYQRDPEKIILVGDCTKKYRGRCITAGGCPPAEPYIMFAILDKRDYYEDDADTRDRFEAFVKKFQEYNRRRKEEASGG